MDDDQHHNKILAFYAKLVNSAIDGCEDSTDIEIKLSEIISICTQPVFDMYGMKWMSYLMKHKLLTSRLIETFGKMIEKCVTSEELRGRLDSVLPYFLRIIALHDINHTTHERILKTVKIVLDLPATDKTFYIQRPIVSYLLNVLKTGIGNAKLRAEVASCYLKLMHDTSADDVKMQHTHHVSEFMRLSTMVYYYGNELLHMLNFQRIIITDFDEVDDYMELKDGLSTTNLYVELTSNISAVCFLCYLLLEKNPHVWTNAAQQMFVKLSSKLLNLFDGMYDTVTTDTLAIVKEIPNLQLLALGLMETIIQSWRYEPEEYSNDLFCIYGPLERFINRKQFKKPWTIQMTNNALLRIRSYQVLEKFYAIMQPKIELSETFMDSFERDIFQNSMSFTNMQVELDGNQKNLRPQNQKGNKDICEAALLALMTIVNTTNAMVPKPSFLRLERRILQHLLQIASTRELNFYPPPFWDENCRFLLYKNLDNFLLNSSQSIPSGYNYGLECFVDGLKDRYHEIRTFSMYALRRLSLIVHHAVPILIDDHPNLIVKPCARYLECGTSSLKSYRLTMSAIHEIQRNASSTRRTEVPNRTEVVTNDRQPVVQEAVSTANEVVIPSTEEVILGTNSANEVLDDERISSVEVAASNDGEGEMDSTETEEPPPKRSRQDEQGENETESTANNETEMQQDATVDTVEEEIDEEEVENMLSDFVDNS